MTIILDLALRQPEHTWMLAPELPCFWRIEGEMGKWVDFFPVTVRTDDVYSVRAVSSSLVVRLRDVLGAANRGMCWLSTDVTRHDSLVNGLPVMVP